MKSFAVMYSTLIIVIVLAIGVSAGIGQQKSADTKSTTPAISDALKAQFFKAQAQQIQAKANFDQAQKALQDSSTAFQSAVQELTKACGEKFVPQMNINGDPACVAKPEPPKPPEPAKK